jgi:hypothetical protein
MDYQEPPRRQSPVRYPAPAQREDRYGAYEDSASFGTGNGYRGFAERASALPQRAPWDDEPWPATTMSFGDTFNGAPESPHTGPSTGGFYQAGAGDDVAPLAGWQDPVGWQADPAVTRVEQAGWLTERAGTRGEPARGGAGLLAGAVAGFLAAAVAIGVANLTAAFVRPQASPIIAVGGAFIDRTPPALKNFAVEKFGENDKNMLLLGMYVTIALIALAIGVLARRRLYVGVAGIGLFGLFGAFVAFTRPESHVTDVIPSIVGGVVGIAAIVWLIRAAGARAGSGQRAVSGHRAAGGSWPGGESPSYTSPSFQDGWAG